ncbi:Chromate resistance protein ChrB [Parafrigoribacterium mesophilum]
MHPILELPEADAAEELLRQCAAICDGYAERVYSALRASAGQFHLAIGE